MPPFRILFLNQFAGPLFRELCEDVANALGPAALLSALPPGVPQPAGANLVLLPAPAYHRRNVATRIWSWLRYFAKAARVAVQADRTTLLFTVSNPPFLPLLGYLLRKLRQQPYTVLVYDLYPHLLENTGRLRSGGWVASLWRAFDRLVWAHAEIVFTIGEHLARNIAATYPANAARRPRVVVIPNWADPAFILPRPKAENWFAQQHGQIGKLTVLYAGNLGSTHDIETIVAAATRLRDDASVAFLIIGAGAKWAFVNDAIRASSLTNTTLLPFQPEKDLPYSLTTGDIAIVSLEKGIEGCSVPSKTYYALASGAALIGISRPPNELADLIDRFQCGLTVAPGDGDGLVNAIQRFQRDPAFLSACRRHARQTLVAHFSRTNTRAYASALAPLVAARNPSSPGTAKRLLDLLLTVPALLLGFPLLLALALLVRLRLGSPVLFRQQRPGLHGRPFTLLKFRTMTNARDTTGALLPDAQRLPPFGRWLRSTSLDELPELLNVLRGDMSLVGPRPLLMEYLPLYSPEQARRHDVRPGITGWAQIHGRNALSWDEKFARDVWYVDHRSFWLDLRILAATLSKVLRREGISAVGEATMPRFQGTGKT